MSITDHPSYRGRLSRVAKTAAGARVEESLAGSAPARRYADRACCCPAAPAVMVIMAPAPGRPTDTELLLCGHHYRSSKAALASTRATVLDMTGHRVTGDAWPDPE